MCLESVLETSHWRLIEHIYEPTYPVTVHVLCTLCWLFWALTHAHVQSVQQYMNSVWHTNIQQLNNSSMVWQTEWKERVIWQNCGRFDFSCHGGLPVLEVGMFEQPLYWRTSKWSINVESAWSGLISMPDDTFDFSSFCLIWTHDISCFKTPSEMNRLNSVHSWPTTIKNRPLVTQEVRYIAYKTCSSWSTQTTILSFTTSAGWYYAV